MSKFKIFDFKILISLVLAALIFAAGWLVGRRGVGAEVIGTISGGRVNSAAVSRPVEVANLPLDWEIFRRVWEALDEKYVNQPLKPQTLFYGAIKGLARATGDPYTAFLPPEDNQRVKDNLNGRYEGIGAELGMRDNQLTVIAPLDGSPAQAAGLRAGDRILKVDGQETQGMTLSEAVGKIRGRAGDPVVLTLERPDDARGEFDLKIVRSQITIKSVSWEDHTSERLKAVGATEGTVYTRVSRFGEQTARDWDTAVGEILSSLNRPPSVVILDLRSNPGGYLQAAIHLASEFVPRGVIVSEQFADGQKKDFLVDHQGRLIGVPVVVLIDGGSASASEILAGALRDRLGAQLVGKKSFGKGTVQDSIEFKDKSSLHVTVAYWLTPKGVKIDGEGLSPDFEVDLDEQKFKADNVDTQLEKALEIVRGG